MILKSITNKQILFVAVLLMFAALGWISYSGPSPDVLNALSDYPSLELPLMCAGYMLMVLSWLILYKKLDHLPFPCLLVISIMLIMQPLWLQQILSPGGLTIIGVLMLLLYQTGKESSSSQFLFFSLLCLGLILYCHPSLQDGKSIKQNLLLGLEHHIWLITALGSTLLFSNKKKWFLITCISVGLITCLLPPSGFEGAIIVMYPVLALQAILGIERQFRYPSHLPVIGVTYLCAILFVTNHFAFSLIYALIACSLFFIRLLPLDIYYRPFLYSLLISFGMIVTITIRSDQYSSNQYFTNKKSYQSFLGNGYSSSRTIICTEPQSALLKFWSSGINEDVPVTSVKNYLNTNAHINNAYMVCFPNEDNLFLRSNINQAKTKIIDQATPSKMTIYELPLVIKVQELSTSLNNFDSPVKNWDFDIKRVNRDYYHSPPFSQALLRYSSSYLLPVRKEELPDYVQTLRVTSNVYVQSKNNELPLLVFALESGDSTTSWKSSPLNSIERENKTEQLAETSIEVSIDQVAFDHLRIYLWNPEEIDANIDDFELQISMY